MVQFMVPCFGRKIIKRQSPSALLMMMTVRLAVSLALLASPADAWMAGATTRAIVATRAASSSVNMIWDPTKDDINDEPILKNHMLQQ
jgi:hypothetical protein